MLSSKSEKSQKGDKGDKGQGFRLTADQHFHLENKRLTNLAPPVDNNDAVTKKKHLADALKVKAGTNYVNNELAKKANESDLKKEAKSYITVWVEEHDSLRRGNLSGVSVMEVKIIAIMVGLHQQMVK